MWDLIVSIPDHCLSFYFGQGKLCRVSGGSRNVDQEETCSLTQCYFLYINL